MDRFEYYILDENDQPRKVPRQVRDGWLRCVDPRRVCVAETHLMYRGEPATVINTRFTGCDLTPEFGTPYLWETKIAYMDGEEVRYQTAEEASERHNDRVEYVIQLLRKDNFIVQRRDTVKPKQRST